MPWIGTGRQTVRACPLRLLWPCVFARRGRSGPKPSGVRNRLAASDRKHGFCERHHSRSRNTSKDRFEPISRWFGVFLRSTALRAAWRAVLVRPFHPAPGVISLSIAGHWGPYCAKRVKLGSPLRPDALSHAPWQVFRARCSRSARRRGPGVRHPGDGRRVPRASAPAVWRNASSSRHGAASALVSAPSSPDRATEMFRCARGPVPGDSTRGRWRSRLGVPARRR
ncbi:hypothetical protein PARU111607_06370 [Palleronia rufa]